MAGQTCACMHACMHSSYRKKKTKTKTKTKQKQKQQTKTKQKIKKNKQTKTKKKKERKRKPQTDHTLSLLWVQAKTNFDFPLQAYFHKPQSPVLQVYFSTGEKILK